MKSLTTILQAKDFLFVPYIMAGANGLGQLQAEIDTLAEAGASAIELGIPFSDPVADGPVIQDAGLKALAKKVTLKKIIELLQTIHSPVPLVLMGYYNSFHHYGLEKLVADLATTDVKGLIIPDLPYEHRDFVKKFTTDSDIALIQLVSLTSTRERMQDLIAAGEGFVYAVTINGTTGTGKDYGEQLDEHLKYITENSELPVLAGFGVSKPEHVERFRQVCDGVVVGSKIVQTLAEEGLPAVSALVKELTA